MDPLTTWALGVAGSVLTKVLPDLISGKVRAARRDEIAQQVELALQQHHSRLQRGILEGVEHQVLRRRIMDEIEILSGRDPDLLMTDQELRLNRRVNIHIPFHRRRRIQNAWAAKLQNLQTVVEHRRRELDNSSEQSLPENHLPDSPEDFSRPGNAPAHGEIPITIPREDGATEQDPPDVSEAIDPPSKMDAGSDEIRLPPDPLVPDKPEAPLPDDEVIWNPAPPKPAQGRWAKKLQDLEVQITLQENEEDHVDE